MRRKTADTVVAYMFLSPFLVVFVVFLGWPVFYSFWLSLHKTTIYSDWYAVFSDMKWVGLENYVRIITQDTRFWTALFFTLCYALLTIPTGMALSLALALALHNELKGKELFRSAYFLPNVLDVLVVGIIWVLIYSPEYGLAETMIRSAASWIGSAAAWVCGDPARAASIARRLALWLIPQGGYLGNPWTVLPSIALAMVLKGAGFGMVLFLTAMNNIPSSVYEAAEIDGASEWQKLRYITLPLLKPIILFMVVTGLMASLNAFSEIYAMTNSTGGPSTQVAGITIQPANLAGFYLFTTFERGQYGYAAAISFVMLVVAIGISLVSKRLLAYEE